MTSDRFIIVAPMIIKTTLKALWVCARRGIIFPGRMFRYHHKFRAQARGKRK